MGRKGGGAFPDPLECFPCIRFATLFSTDSQIIFLYYPLIELSQKCRQSLGCVLIVAHWNFINAWWKKAEQKLSGRKNGKRNILSYNTFLSAPPPPYITFCHFFKPPYPFTSETLVEWFQSDFDIQEQYSVFGLALSIL